ncbi:MAG: hypothetical protein HYX27_02850 [Acidobacteria bacterium]|nr:hypothetical protein [Acidobacteriota bacterium]
MPLSILNLGVVPVLPGVKIIPPKLPAPNIDRLIPAETPAIALQIAPALEDLIALTAGIPPDLSEQIDVLLTGQAQTAFPGAAVVGVATGEKPDYDLLKKDPATLSGADHQRFLDEFGKLIARRQTFGIFLREEGKGGLAGRKKGAGAISLTLDITPLLAKTGAPFAIRIGLEDVVTAANTVIHTDNPRYSLAGDECACGPVAITSLELRRTGPGKLETVVTGQVDILLGAAHSGFELHVNESLGVDSRGDLPGVLAEANATANIEVLQIVGAQLPEKVKKVLERDFVKALLLKVAPVPSLIAFALRALASRIATNKVRDGDDVRGPVHDALEKVLATQLVKGTDKKVMFDLKSASPTVDAIELAGTILVVDRQQSLRIRNRATGRRVGGPDSHEFDIRFRAIALDMAEPVRYTWKCLGQEVTGDAEATFRIDLTVDPEFTVSVSAVDADGFALPASIKTEIRSRFRQSAQAILGMVVLQGVSEDGLPRPVRP